MIIVPCLQIKSCDGLDEYLEINNEVMTNGAPPAVNVGVTEWEGSRVAHEAGMLLNGEQAVEVINYLSSIFDLRVTYDI